MVQEEAEMVHQQQHGLRYGSRSRRAQRQAAEAEQDNGGRRAEKGRGQSWNPRAENPQIKRILSASGMEEMKRDLAVLPWVSKTQNYGSSSSHDAQTKTLDQMQTLSSCRKLLLVAPRSRPQM
jgi:regulator of protease activity HflC (stomatin/prohibitin superfamily)